MLYNYSFNPAGVKEVARQNQLNPAMLMDVRVYRLAPGQSLAVNDTQNETALLLLAGEVEFAWQGAAQKGERKNVFEEKPYALHLPAGCPATVTALQNSEVLLQATHNTAVFEPKFYTPADCTLEHLGEAQWGGTAERLVLTVFDYKNAPYSNMVLGEVTGLQGRWSSYVPHSHAQPEVYYYKFDKPQGFGAAFIGDDAYKITDGSASCIPGGLVHPQVAAPGYRMYYCWMIRHLEGNPWTDRVVDPAHAWLLDL